jgi:predicted outer membrane repeat protein
MTHTGSTTGRFLYVRAGAAAAVYDSTLSGGNVTGFSNGYGGAIQNLGTLDLGFGTQLLNNSADNGGALYNKDGTVNVYDATLEGNTATRAGGGIYNISTVAAPGDSRGLAFVSGTNLKIRYNTAKAGGGVFNRGSRMMLTGPQIRFNTSSGSGSGETCHSGTSCDGNGAGALNINTSSGIRGTFQTTSADIFGNSAAGRGGGVYAGGEITLYNTGVSWNDALTGGAIYVIEDQPGRYCEVRTIDNGTATIEFNDATAAWGFSVLDGDGTSGTGGAHCKFYNPAGGTFTDQGHADPKCEADRAAEDGTSVCQ